MSASYWVAFAKTLPMMLLFGIVGPIFLVVYFLIDEPDVEWMLWWGLAVTALDVVLAAVVARSYDGIFSGRRRPEVTTQIYRSVVVESSVSTPAAPETAAPEGTPAERLAELDELMKKDLLTTEEYDASRKRILGEL